MNFRRLILPALVASTMLIAGCSPDSVDVTNSAGDPVTQSPAAQGTGGSVAVPDSAGSEQADSEEADSEQAAPPCPPEVAAGADSGLSCLGPGPNVEVLELSGVTVVPVWASWCEPCRAELPILQELHESGTKVVGIAAADNSSAAASLTQDLRLTFPSAQDPDSTTRASLGWSALPATFVLRDGEIVGRISGEVTSVAQLRQAIESSR